MVRFAPHYNRQLAADAVPRIDHSEAAGGAAHRPQYRIHQEITTIAAELANVKWATQNPEIQKSVAAANVACDRVSSLLASLTRS